jgi:hypothetical protein
MTVVGGADIWQNLFVFNESKLNLSGGRVREPGIAHDRQAPAEKNKRVGDYPRMVPNTAFVRL